MNVIQWIVVMLLLWAAAFFIYKAAGAQGFEPVPPCSTLCARAA